MSFVPRYIVNAPNKRDDVLCCVSAAEIINWIAQRMRMQRARMAFNLQHWAVREVLRLLLTLIFVAGRQSTNLRIHGPTLLPKDWKDPWKAVIYRPITIISILSTLFWGVLSERIGERVRFTPRQKGFTSEAGCFNKVSVLDMFLKHTKRNAGLITVDVSNAITRLPKVLFRMGCTEKDYQN